MVLKQYSGVTISGTLTAKDWNGDVGGILAWVCSGQTNNMGTITASNKGFRGAGGGSAQQLTGRNGEGSAGAGWSRTTSANGSGGGGGGGGAGDHAGVTGAGAGGGNGAAGTNGASGDTYPGGTGGSTSGSSDLTTMTFGGAGGEGGTRNNSSTTGAVEGFGGGIILIFSKIFINTGSIASNGQDAVKGDSPEGEGGGAGGSIFIKGQSLTLGSGLITATGGARAGAGGAGGLGIIRAEACSRTGTTNPGAFEQVGGFNFCGGANAIIG